MKTIYAVNKITLIITLILYLTIYLGLYAQILLGAVQVLSSFLLLLFWRDLSQIHKKRLVLYWMLIACYGLGWILNWNNFQDTIYVVIGIIIIPMGIAIYFTRLLYIITKTESN